LLPSAKPWVRIAAVFTVAQMAASVLLPRGYVLTAISDSVCALLVLTLVIAFARNAVLAHGRLRSVWTLQAVCWSFWLIDQCAWLVYDVILRKPLPEMFPGDVILFLAGVPMLAGLLLRPHLEPSQHSVRLGILDFLQLMLWWVFFYVYLVMCWQYISINATLYNRNYDRLYLIEVFVLVAVLALLLRQSRGAWKRFYACFLGAVVFNSIAVIAENSAIEQKTYFNGSWYDIPFIASIAYFMTVAMRGRELTPVPEAGEHRKYGAWMAGLAMVAVLSLPVIMIAVALGKGESPEITRFRLLTTAITMMMMTAMVLVKQRRLHQELKKTNRVLEQASMTDPLTGIRNRRYFSETIEGDVAQALRAHKERREDCKRDLVFYLIDLDNFKQVNDQYGHDAGDRVLVETARRLASVVRDSDVLLRWGGEEFLIVSRCADRREADAAALRVMQAVRSESFPLSPFRSIRRTCSIGWAAFPWREDDLHAMSYEDVLNMADRALGQAKRAGKDQAIGMTPSSSGPNPPLPFRRGMREDPTGHEWESESSGVRSYGRSR
jgi:diguanylate cyclase (GGDEF)-like protein